MDDVDECLAERIANIVLGGEILPELLYLADVGHDLLVNRLIL